jgi:hypothetical protein
MSLSRCKATDGSARGSVIIGPLIAARAGGRLAGGKPRHGMDDPPPPGFDRVVISCRACGGVETLDLQAGVMTPERLSIISPRCSECGSPDIEIAVITHGGGQR